MRKRNFVQNCTFCCDLENKVKRYHHSLKEIACGNEILFKIAHFVVTLKIRSSPKSNQLFLLSTMYLCKFGQNPPTGSGDRAWKRSYVDADADGISTKSSMYIMTGLTLTYFTASQICLYGGMC